MKMLPLKTTKSITSSLDHSLAYGDDLSNGQRFDNVVVVGQDDETRLAKAEA